MTYQEALEKLKKLFALGGSPEPHEAAAAMRQVAKLMEKFNIDEGDVARASVSVHEIRSLWGVSRQPVAEAALINQISLSFGCRVVWVRSSSFEKGKDVYGIYKMFGLEHRLEPAVYVATYLQRQLYVARQRYAKSLKEQGFKDRAIVKVHVDSFMLGWMQAVITKVKAMELDPAEEALLNEAMGDVIDTKKRKVNINNSALLTGADAGRDVQISRGVGGREQLMIGG